MRFSLSSLVRLIALLAIVSTVMALGVARLDPARPIRRIPEPARYTGVSEFFLEGGERTLRWLDAESGQIIDHPLTDSAALETATLAPWVDDQGQTEVVGRWTSRTAEGPMSMTHDIGLARYTFPGGEPIDQLSLELIPVGPPCFFPKTRGRILFVAGDGMLYHFDFDAIDPTASRSGSSRLTTNRPVELAWRPGSPSHDEIFFADVAPSPYW